MFLHSRRWEFGVEQTISPNVYHLLPAPQQRANSALPVLVQNQDHPLPLPEVVSPWAETRPFYTNRGPGWGWGPGGNDSP